MIGSARRSRFATWAHLLALGAAICWGGEASAHELRPAYLQMVEQTDGEFAALWKTPMRGELRLDLWPEFTGSTEALTPVTTRHTGDAAVQRWRMRATEPLRGQSVSIRGLDGTMTDTLVRIEFADGSAWVKRLTPMQPEAVIPMQPSVWAVAREYMHLGVEHILLGIDHLLFVLALLLVTRGRWLVVKTITAFTVAHSITLGLATLGVVLVPSAPVEAVIALSIVLVAVEAVRSRAGRAGLAARAPWIVAFAFGLLHGFGFAGALAEVGLPESHIPTALLFFNLGVEAGQLVFVAAVVVAIAGSRRVRDGLPKWAELLPPYAIGSLATFWVIQRVAAF